ncbi:MAG: hypothetical protein COS84_02930 [Armatimonadetes bacterium CG07_land_8_20_14_0_80_40_9]|nr:MAG: hypothetical protein COS84_02930 [Armatimonadetes bacterium CG07_land_8_20_14_0_80_40_9]
MEYIASTIVLILTLGVFSQGKAKREIERKLRQRLGRVEDVRVHISSSPFKILTGQIDKIQIEAYNFKVDGFPVSCLQITLHKLKVNPLKVAFKRKVRLKSIGEARGTFIIREEDLSRYLQARGSLVEDLRVKLLPGRFILVGRIKTFLISPSFGIEGKLKVVRRSQIVLEIPRAQISIIPIPRLLIQPLLALINPIFDLEELSEFSSFWADLEEISDYSLPFKLVSFQIKDKTLVIEGRAELQKP